ncbi:MAG: VOC family protein, partial [Alphaproteobacteria bacterium]
ASNVPLLPQTNEKMMNGDIDSVNHAGLVVGDLFAAARRFEAMGFVLSPLSMHKGATKPGVPATDFGSGNRCAVFPNNYLEIVAHVVKDKADVFVGKYLDRFEGMHIICFGCKNAGTVDARLRAAGVETSGVIPLQRDVDTAEGRRTAKFDCVHFGSAATPEGLVQAAFHLTPQYIHQPAHIAHPNECVALSNAYVAAAEPAAVARRYEMLTGQKARRDGAKYVIDLPLVSRVTILPRDEVPKELPGAAMRSGDYMPGFAFATTDMNAVTRHLEAAGIPFARANGMNIVPASAAFGAAVAFERA